MDEKIKIKSALIVGRREQRNLAVCGASGFDVLAEI